MVDVSLGWKVFKMPFLLLAILITLKRSDTKRRYLKEKQKSSHDFMFPKENMLFLSVLTRTCEVYTLFIRRPFNFKDITYRP